VGGKLNFNLIKKGYVKFLCGEKIYANFHSETTGKGEIIRGNEVLGEIAL